MTKPKKSTTSSDLRVGPFVLTKGRGARWSLKGVKGVRFVVQKQTYSEQFGAYVSMPSLGGSGIGATPKKAAQDAAKNARWRVREFLTRERHILREAQRDIAYYVRHLKTLTTGKAPGAKPKAKKR